MAARRHAHEKHAPDAVIFLTTLALLSLGIIMVFSASSVSAYEIFRDTYYFLKRQLAWAAMGFGVMFVAMEVDYRLWKRLAWPALLLSLVLLVAVLVPGVGIMIRGSRRWLGAGSLTFQPSEVAKVVMVFFMASFLADRTDRIHRFSQGLLEPLLILGIVFGLTMLEPDLGTAATIAGISLLLMFASGASLSHLGILAAMAAPALVAVAMAAPYRVRRFLAFLHPWEDPLGSGFHIIQSLLALGSGGILGVGLGRSRQKFLYLPMQHTDFIFAIIGEELGFVGAASVVVLYFLFAWRGLRVAIGAPDTFGSLLAVGITSMIVLQAMINIGVVSGTLPITGITLPLISFGGSSLVTTLASIGVLLNISKYSSIR